MWTYFHIVWNLNLWFWHLSDMNVIHWIKINFHHGKINERSFSNCSCYCVQLQGQQTSSYAPNFICQFGGSFDFMNITKRSLYFLSIDPQAPNVAGGGGWGWGVGGGWGVGNYIHVKQCDLITHLCPNFNGGLVKPPMKIGYGSVLTSHRKIWLWLLAHVLVLVKPYCRYEGCPRISTYFIGYHKVWHSRWTVNPLFTFEHLFFLRDFKSPFYQHNLSWTQNG